MNEPALRIRPETLALDALIKETIARAEAFADSGPADTMLFLGNRHQSFPTSVVKDPVLEPVDKLVWMVIMLAVRETGGNTAFPGYDAIGKMANVSSRSTIARAIAILRATRWLTLCARIRKTSGRFRGNVYALHDEPLPLADAFHLDSDYMAFLSNARTHGHARVRAVAQGVLESMDEDIQAGRDVCAQEHPLERRIQSMVASEESGPRRFFAFTENVVRRLWSDSTSSNKAAIHHDQNSNSGEHRVRKSNAQNSNTGCSSSYINKTTTTNNGDKTKFVLTGEDGRPLIYPGRLLNNQRDVADRYLHTLAPEQRQPILDELEGRFRAEQKGMKPLYDELSFLNSLCKAVRKGKFQPNLGIKVRNGRLERDRSRRRAGQANAEKPAGETDEQRKQRMAVARERLADIRNTLGISTSTKKQNVTDESSSR